jgi:hypothetical protein
MNLENFQNQEDNSLIYNISDAADLVYENLPEDLANKYSLKDIFIILSLQEKYLVSIGYYYEEGGKKPIAINKR